MFILFTFLLMNTYNIIIVGGRGGEAGEAGEAGGGGAFCSLILDYS